MSATNVTVTGSLHDENGNALSGVAVFVPPASSGLAQVTSTVTAGALSATIQALDNVNTWDDEWTFYFSPTGDSGSHAIAGRLRPLHTATAVDLLAIAVNPDARLQFVARTLDASVSSAVQMLSTVGAPTFAGTAGQSVVDASGVVYTCSAPGSWFVATGGVTLANVQSTTLNAAVSTASTAFAGLTATVTVGVRPIEIFGSVPSAAVTAGTGRFEIGIYEGATLIELAASTTVAATTTIGSLSVGLEIQPSAGSHTYTLNGLVVGGATAGSVVSGVGFPAQLRIKSA